MSGRTYRLRVVLDTCALVWSTCAQERLSDAARRLVEREDTSYVISAISIWEIALKVRKEKLSIGTTPAKLLGRLRRLASMQILDITPDIWLANVALDWAHRDLADRTIVATASSLQLPIVTRDQRILDFYPESIKA